MRHVPGHGRTLSYYDFGRTTVYACQADPRFSYCAYIPRCYDEDDDDRFRLLVAIHGTGRDMMATRDHFIDLAERHRLIVLAPLFPGGITAPRELSSYKRLRLDGIHYDTILLAMIDELATVYRIGKEKFSLFGFSGGGHFAHRFFYAHPGRLEAVSIGAPGVVTLLDPDRDLMVGVRDAAEIFGAPIDLDAMRDTAVQMIVGDDDTDSWEITIPPGSPWWQEGVNAAGANRKDRLRSLRDSFEKHGIAVRLDIVPGVAHRLDGLVSGAEAFFSDVFTSRQRTDHRNFTEGNNK